MIDRVVIFLISLLPIGALAIKKWSNAFFLLAIIGSIISLAQRRDLPYKPGLWVWTLCLTLCAPIVADVISQILRAEIVTSQLDASFRLLLGIPILLFFLDKIVIDEKIFTLVIGSSVIATVLSVVIAPTGVNFWGRWATVSADPNSLGCITAIATGSLVYLCLRHLTNKQWMMFVFALITLVTGLYILIRSQSRGGWLVFALLLPVVLSLAKRQELKGVKPILLCLAASAAYIFFTDSTLTARAQSIYFETKDWWQNPSNTATSIGIRLNMLKASWSLITYNPILGYGDHGYGSVLSSGALGQFSPTTIHGMSASPHNEIIGKTLKSGIFGGFASLFVFAVPFLFFSKLLKSRNSISQNIPASLGLILVSGFFISGLSAGILGLTYLSSLYAATVTSLAGLALSTNQQK